MRKNKFFTASVISALLLISLCAHAKEGKAYIDSREFARAKVEKIERIRGEGAGASFVEVRVHLRILDGERKGRTHVSVYRGEDDMPRDMFYHEGDTVYIGISTMPEADEVEQISIYDVDNTTGIIILGVLLVASIIFVGRLRGALSMLSLIATIILIF